MKKTVTTLILSLLSALCVFAFTACGEKESEEQETVVRNTVTESEWKAAIAIIADRETSITSNCEAESSEGVSMTLLEADMENSILHINHDFSENNGSEGSSDYYIWKAADAKYYMSDVDSETIYKKEIDKEDYEVTVREYLWHYAGANLFNGVKASEKFSSFTYNEESKGYSATLPVDSSITDFSDDAKLVIYFENEKIVKMEASLIKNETNYVFEYEYGKTATVPSNILNASAEE